MCTLEAEGMETVQEFAQRLVMLANTAKTRVTGRFNECTLIATPATSVDAVFEQWDVDMRRSYFGESSKFKTLSQ